MDANTFIKAKSFVAEICGELDITPTLIHVGMFQYSDMLNTRIEFGLDQYTKYHQINQSLQNVFHSKGSTSDLENALRIIDKQVQVHHIFCPWRSVTATGLFAEYIINGIHTSELEWI